MSEIKLLMHKKVGDDWVPVNESDFGGLPVLFLDEFPTSYSNSGVYVAGITNYSGYNGLYSPSPTGEMSGGKPIYTDGGVEHAGNPLVAAFIYDGVSNIWTWWAQNDVQWLQEEEGEYDGPWQVVDWVTNGGLSALEGDYTVEEISVTDGEIGQLAVIDLSSEDDQVWICTDNNPVQWEPLALGNGAGVEIDAFREKLGVDTVNADIVALQNDANALEARVTAVEGDIDGLDDEIGSIDARLDTAESDINIIESNASTLAGRVTTAENDINAAEASIVTVDAKLIPLPWKISGCLGFYDWNDTVRDASAPYRITQWNDKSGNSKHASRAADTARSQWTERGAYGQAGPYTIGGGGLTGFSSQSGTFIWIGADFTTQNTAGGIATGSGYIYAESGVRCAVYGGYANMSNGSTYNPPLIFAPAGATSIYAQIFGSARAQYYANGMLTIKSAVTLASPTITRVLAFSDPAAGTQFTRITQVMAFFNRELTTAEIASIANYYGAPTAPPATIVYSIGSSTPAGQNSGSYEGGCVARFANNIGAHQCTYFVGGGSWNTAADSYASTGVQLYKGVRGIHLVMPQHNDLANNISVATCQTAITNHVNRIRTADPFAQIIFCPITPRNASFSGITYDTFDTRRLELNTWMEGQATANWGMVYCDAMTIDKLGDKGDEADTTYFDPDKIHMNAAGHLQYGLSIYRAYMQLFTGI